MIIGLCGLIGSGKDTAADYLCNFHEFRRDSFASTLKDAVASVFGWDRELLEGRTKQAREWREQIDPWWAERLNMPHLTPRWILQYWGTEVCRHGFHKDIWVASLENKILKCEGNIVITDARFANELSVVKKLNGKLIRIERGELPNWYDDAVRFNQGLEGCLPPQGVHASEYSSVGLEYDCYLGNNGTKEDLFASLNLIINL